MDFFEEKRDALDTHLEWSPAERDRRELQFLNEVENDLISRLYIYESNSWNRIGSRVTLFEIVQFSLFDEEEANLVFLFCPRTRPYRMDLVAEPRYSWWNRGNSPGLSFARRCGFDSRSRPFLRVCARLANQVNQPKNGTLDSSTKSIICQLYEITFSHF